MTGSVDRGPDLTLAHIHLRLGSLALARAELEAIAGQDALDEDGLLDLAEARWRTGDLTGAGEAATALLERDRNPVVALVIAAEAAAARGRPSEARRLAARALEAAGGDIDPTFAGMPRASIWPADPAAPPPAPTTLFHAPEPSGPAQVGATATAPATPDAGPGDEAQTATAAASLRLWDLPGEPLPGEPALPPAESELAEGREALAAGDVTAAATHLAIVLRLSPSLAPDVLDLVGDRTERVLALVRGDAYRLVGREADARRAFADAAKRGRDWDQASAPDQDQVTDRVQPPDHEEFPDPEEPPDHEEPEDHEDQEVHEDHEFDPHQAHEPDHEFDPYPRPTEPAGPDHPVHHEEGDPW